MKQKIIEWLIDTGVRCVKTMAQAGLAYLATAQFISDVNWVMFASVCGMSAILCILTNLASLPTKEPVSKEEL